MSVRKKGLEKERYVLNAFLRHRPCRKPLSDLHTRDFATSYRDQRLKEIKPASLKRQLAPIHNLFEVAKDEWGLPIKENPLGKVRLPNGDNRRERRLRGGDLERLIEAAGTRRNPLIVPIIVFAV